MPRGADEAGYAAIDSGPSGKVSSYDKRLGVWFFLLGAGSTVTYTAVVMALAYLQMVRGFGPNVLILIARSHNVSLVVCMMSLIAKPRPLSVRAHARLLAGAYLASSGVACVLLISTQIPFLNGEILYACVALNGAAAGIGLGLVASLGGLFDPYSLAKGVGVSQLQGLAFGVLAPTLLRIALLLGQQEAGVKAAATLSATLGSLLALALCSAALAALAALTRTSVFKAVQAVEEGSRITIAPDDDHAHVDEQCPTCNDRSTDTIGKCAVGGPELRSFLRGRVVAVGPVAAAQFLNAVFFVFLLLVSPRLPIVKEDMFWVAYLATLVIASCNVAGFLGRSLQLSKPKRNELWPFTYALAAPLGYSAARVYAAGTPLPGLASMGNFGPIVLFSIVAAASGRAVIVLSQLAQAQCGHDHEVICPIAAQIILLSMQLGSLLATLLS